MSTALPFAWLRHVVQAASLLVALSFVTGLELLPAAHAAPVLEEGTLTLSDGTRVGLLRAQPGVKTHADPVLLIADFGLSPEVFSFRGRGLLHALLDAGREVVVLDWRRTDLSAGLVPIVSRVLPAAIAATAGEGGRKVDVVAHGHAGSLVYASAVGPSRGRIGRVVALSTPVAPPAPSPVLEGMLTGGGALSTLALTGAGLHVLELLLTDGSDFPSGFWGRIRRGGLIDLPPRLVEELLVWLREGTLRLGPGDTLTTRLADYDRPTLLFLPLGDNLAPPEAAAPLRELSPRAQVTPRQLSRLDLLEEDYSHLGVLQGRHAPRDVWAPALRFLAGGTP